MGPAIYRGVIGRADARHDRAEIVVPEVELQHLERSLDGERRKRVDDRAKAGQREPARNTDHQLLADADVDDPVGMRTERVPHPGLADVRDHHGHPLVAVDELHRGRIEAFAHRRAHPFDSTTATTA